ncbi:hypothetical protein [Catellatospora sichuanensis]|uniref:RipA family octameric membrane protein n=1 Tax=Catellatospora sichuanensis TaxID=1969805 RepID=UPI0011823DEA|nr:hypothetical protein [Catellatospora sichuanensis]
MTLDTRAASDSDPAELAPADNARVGYQVATALMTYEGNVIWVRFGTMLVAHTVMVAVLGMAVESGVSGLAQLGLVIAGLVLCGSWVLLHQRGFDYYVYWILSMRELEEQHLAPTRTVSRGAAFAAGQPVELTVGGRTVRHRMSRLGRMRVAWVSYVVIGVFALLYVAQLVMTLVGMVS